MSTQLTLSKLKDVIAAYVAANKIAQPAPFVVSAANTAGLLDKIAKTFTIDGIFEDKLPELDGDNLELAKTLEEWYANLILPTAHDDTGANALAPADLSYTKPCYSYTLGRQQVKDTKRNDDLERAFTSQEGYISILDMVSKRLYDSYGQAKYMMKKELLAKYGAACESAMSVAGTTLYAKNTAYAIGTSVRKDASTFGVVVQAITGSNTLEYDAAVTAGLIVNLDLVSTLPAPTDTATGEAFIKAVKEYVRKSQFVSEGNSLNGNCVGASTGMLLIINAKYMPSIEVDTYAGAFNKGDVLFNVDTKEIDDFAGDTSGIYAMLIDRRGCRLHNSYLAVRNQENAEGDFMNYIMHYENTAAFSRNTFVHVFKAQ